MHKLLSFLLFTVLVVPGPALAQASTATETTAIVNGAGSVTRPADMATLNVNVLTNDDDSATATSKNNEIFAAVKAAWVPLGVSDADIKTTYYNVSFVPRPVVMTDARPAMPTATYPIQYQPRYGYVVSRQLQIAILTLANVGKIVDTSVAANVSNINGVQYSLIDRKAANEAALTLALEDAASQARSLAAASGMHIVRVKTFQVGQAYAGPVPGPNRVILSDVKRVATDLPPSTVDVRANVTVTYVLK